MIISDLKVECNLCAPIENSLPARPRVHSNVLLQCFRFDFHVFIQIERLMFTTGTFLILANVPIIA